MGSLDCAPDANLDNDTFLSTKSDDKKQWETRAQNSVRLIICLHLDIFKCSIRKCR